jgi:uncharacterized protein (TIGR02147 family)
MKPLVEYTDYRAYLTDWLAQRRAEGLPVSNRWFAMKMGVKSTSWLTTILQGKKNLSKESSNRVSSIIKHDSFETRYFETLVFFNQARVLDERNRYYSDLVMLQKSRTVKLVTGDQYEFYTCWYHSVIRSLIGMHGFDGDYSRLASMVSPPISAAQAKKSVELLEKLGFIAKNGDGRYVLSASAISSGAEVRSLAVANFQQETMRLAQEAIDRYPAATRDIRTITVGISEKTYHEIKNILDEAKKRVIELANSDEAADRVYQLNFQLYPLSKPPSAKEARQ